MVQKISIDPGIVDDEILKNSLSKIDIGLQNLREIKKLENPSIFINDKIKTQIFKNISQLKFVLNKKVNESDEFKKLSNESIRIESLMHHLLNSPEYIYKFKQVNLNNIDFKNYVSKLYCKFGSSFLDYILVQKIIKSGFKEIEGSLSNFLEEKSSSPREYYFSREIRNFKDFAKIILDKLGFNQSEKNQKLYLINPGILRTIDSYKKENQKNLRKFRDLCVTIKCICYYFLEKFMDTGNLPTIVVATDNPGNKFDEDSLRNIFNLEFEEITKRISVHLIVTKKWAKKSKHEQRFIFSSNEFGFGSNVDLDFLRNNRGGTTEEDYRLIEDNYLQFKVAPDGILNEISQPSYKNFVNNDLIEIIENKLNLLTYQTNQQENLKNPAFQYALEKFNA